MLIQGSRCIRDADHLGCPPRRVVGQCGALGTGALFDDCKCLARNKPFLQDSDCLGQLD